MQCAFMLFNAILEQYMKSSLLCSKRPCPNTFVEYVLGLSFKRCLPHQQFGRSVLEAVWKKNVSGSLLWRGPRWEVRGWRRSGWGLWLCAVRVLRTPQRFQLWSKYGPRGPSPAPGHTNPRPAHIPALFSWLQNASGNLSWWGVLFSFFLYLLIKCVLEELSKCEEPSCRLTFSFI